MRKRPSRTIYRDSRGKFRWRLKGANGLIVATSGEGDGFSSRGGARRNYERVKSIFSNETIVERDEP